MNEQKNSTVEVASFVNGEFAAASTLSRAREDRETLLARIVAGAAVSGVLALALLVAAERRWILLAPLVLSAWAVVLAAVVFVAGRRARDRAAKFIVGSALDCDAFGANELTLVRRAGDRYEILLVPGMTGNIENGRAPLPVEALTQAGPVRVELPESGRAQLTLGPTSFAIRWTVATERPMRFGWKRFARLALTPALAAAAITFVTAVPTARGFTDEEMRSSIPKDASPWETEKFLRFAAQMQSQKLHACFDALPLECQLPGYVAVGLKLTKEGEVYDNWVSRSTYRGTCNPTECMANVASSFFFEPLPEPITIILPVQVLRTGRQMMTVAQPVETAP